MKEKTLIIKNIHKVTETVHDIEQQINSILETMIIKEKSSNKELSESFIRDKYDKLFKRIIEVIVLTDDNNKIVGKTIIKYRELCIWNYDSELPGSSATVMLYLNKSINNILKWDKIN